MKIKLAHLFSQPNCRREKTSAASMSRLDKNFGIEYVKIINPPFKGPVPRNSVNDDIVVDYTPRTIGGNLLGPGHYGCWKAHKDAVIDCFSEDLDFFIICECDCALNVSVANFGIYLGIVCRIMNGHNIGYLSFGGGHSQPSKVEPKSNNFKRYTERPQILRRVAKHHDQL